MGPAHLWHLNRRSVSRAFGVGLFWMMIPLPMHSIPAILTAVVARANVAMVFALLWIANPFTLPLRWWMAYEVGRATLGLPRVQIEYQISWLWKTITNPHTLLTVGGPLFMGGLVIGGGLGMIGFTTVSGIWRWALVRRWQKRGVVVETKRRVENGPDL